MTDKYTLGPRLQAAASMVRKNAFVADVGTDHAYLPIALCLDGDIRGGVVSDINRGPIDRARENIKKYGLESKLTAVQTDGLNGIEGFAPEDILILGMGGELIASILGEAIWTKKKGVRLCLQPMTHPEHLRTFLCQNGYAIIDERIAREDRKIYQIILAEYTGDCTVLSQEELLLGRINISRGGDDLVALGNSFIPALEKRMLGIESTGVTADAERQLIAKIKATIQNK